MVNPSVEMKKQDRGQPAEVAKSQRFRSGCCRSPRNERDDFGRMSRLMSKETYETERAPAGCPEGRRCAISREKGRRAMGISNNRVGHFRGAVRWGALL